MTKAKKKKKKFKKMTVPEIVILVVITVLLLVFVYMLIKPALRRTQPLGNLEGVLEKDYSSYELKDENNADDGLDIEHAVECRNHGVFINSSFSFQDGIKDSFLLQNLGAEVVEVDVEGGDAFLFQAFHQSFHLLWDG